MASIVTSSRRDFLKICTVFCSYINDNHGPYDVKHSCVYRRIAKPREGQTNRCIHCCLLITCTLQQPLALCCENSGWALKETDSKDYLGPAQNKNQRKTAEQDRRVEREIQKRRKQNREKKKPIKIYVLSPWRPMSCLKSPEVKVRGHRLGSEVISYCFGLTTIV